MIKSAIEYWLSTRDKVQVPDRDVIIASEHS